MKKIGIIGHIDQGKTTLTTAIKNVLDIENKSIYHDAIQEIYEYKNNYAFLNEKQPASKTRLNKCKKGLHEFLENGFSENNIKKWSCIHCGVLMHNR
jgi:translation initiation factor 2 gamma subunit (eIF-2gamma)